MAINIARPKGRSVRSLRMVWRYATQYPGHIAVAIVALAIVPVAVGVADVAVARTTGLKP